LDADDLRTQISETRRRLDAVEAQPRTPAFVADIALQGRAYIEVAEAYASIERLHNARLFLLRGKILLAAAECHFEEWRDLIASVDAIWPSL
jgi:hypothetical protein